MYFAGVDSGSRTVKAVIMKDNEIIASHVEDMGASSRESSEVCLQKVLKDAGLKLEEMDYVGSTGYGRELLPGADVAYTDIACHTKGIFWYFPTVRTILDLGGQDYKAISCDEKGRVQQFVMNEKCAGGTGRFLEVMADVLDVTVPEMGQLGEQAERPVKLSSTCTVFAQSEVLNLMRTGAPKNSLIAGLNNLVAEQSFKLLSKVNVNRDLAMTGGTSKNIAVVRRVQELVGMTSLLPPNPQLVGAVGAAVLARAKFMMLQARNKRAT